MDGRTDSPWHSAPRPARGPSRFRARIARHNRCTVAYCMGRRACRRSRQPRRAAARAARGINRACVPGSSRRGRQSRPGRRPVRRQAIFSTHHHGCTTSEETIRMAPQYTNPTVTNVKFDAVHLFTTVYSFPAYRAVGSACRRLTRRHPSVMTGPQLSPAGWLPRSARHQSRCGAPVADGRRA
jgi:hypothetical protein